ncbi:MAG: hypothetical protein AB3N12_07395 [Ruegeria sp.]
MSYPPDWGERTMRLGLSITFNSMVTALGGVTLADIPRDWVILPA